MTLGSRNTESKTKQRTERTEMKIDIRQLERNEVSGKYPNALCVCVCVSEMTDVVGLMPWHWAACHRAISATMCLSVLLCFWSIRKVYLWFVCLQFSFVYTASIHSNSHRKVLYTVMQRA